MLDNPDKFDEFISEVGTGVSITWLSICILIGYYYSTALTAFLLFSFSSMIIINISCLIIAVFKMAILASKKNKNQ